MAVKNPPDPVRTRAGRVAARARWGPARIIRLDGLSADERRLVVAMLEAAKAATKAGAA
jgi:hypothetical protein